MYSSTSLFFVIHFNGFFYSLFQSQTESVQIIIQEGITSQLVRYIQNPLGDSDTPQQTVNHINRRQIVDIINGLLENFPLGVKCLKCIWKEGMYE